MVSAVCSEVVDCCKRKLAVFLETAVETDQNKRHNEKGKGECQHEDSGAQQQNDTGAQAIPSLISK